MADKSNPETLTVEVPMGWMSSFLATIVGEKRDQIMDAGAKAAKALLADPAHMQAVIEAAAKRAVEEHAKYLVNRALSDTVYHDAEGARLLERTTYEAILRVVQTKLDGLA